MMMAVVACILAYSRPSLRPQAASRPAVMRRAAPCLKADDQPEASSDLSAAIGRMQDGRAVGQWVTLSPSESKKALETLELAKEDMEQKATKGGTCGGGPHRHH